METKIMAALIDTEVNIDGKIEKRTILHLLKTNTPTFNWVLGIDSEYITEIIRRTGDKGKKPGFYNISSYVYDFAMTVLVDIDTCKDGKKSIKLGLNQTKEDIIKAVDNYVLVMKMEKVI